MFSSLASNLQQKFGAGSQDAPQDLDAQLDAAPLSGGAWACEACTFHNPANATQCEACGGPRPQHSLPPTAAQSAGQWACEACTFHNPANSVQCEACGSVRPQGQDPAGSTGSHNRSMLPPTSRASVDAGGLTSNGLPPFANAPYNNGKEQLPPQGSLDLSPNMLPPQHTMGPQDLQQELSLEGESPNHSVDRPPHDIIGKLPPQNSLPPTSMPSKRASLDNGTSRPPPQNSLPPTSMPPKGASLQSRPAHQTPVSSSSMNTQLPQGYPADMSPPHHQTAQPPTYISAQMHSATALQGSLGGSKLLLRVLRAYDLRNTDLGIMPEDASDPFVVARLGRKEVKTHVIENSLNPVWNSQQFEFPIPDDEAEPRLELEVYSSNHWHANESLGLLHIPIRSLTPGEVHTARERLDEGDIVREDGKKARIQVELQLLGQEHLLNPRGVQQGTLAKTQREAKQQFQLQRQQQQQQKQLALRDQQQANNHVPLPSFKDMGPEAFARPAKQVEVAKVGEARRLNEYESLACRLGQYDYSQPAAYYPKQELVDKRQWKDDAFYGWRKELNRVEHNASDANIVEETDETMNEAWRNDPFHGWLQHDSAGRPNFSGIDQSNNVAKVQEAHAARRLMSLPSFTEAPVRRFDDHREYASHAPAVNPEPRQRLGSDWRGGTRPGQLVEPAEKRWKDDAFFGWLPGRGQDTPEQHKLRRPLEQARLARLPSFADGTPELAGVTGRGIGVLTVWVNEAKDLAYSYGSGLQGAPSARVQLSIGSAGQQGKPDSDRTKATETRSLDSNPRWNSPAMTFEVCSILDVLELEVQDLANPRSQEHIHHYFLGRTQIPVQQVLDTMEQTQNYVRPIHFRQDLEGSQRQAQLDFKCLYEPYDTEASHSLTAPEPSTSSARIGSKNRSKNVNQRSQMLDGRYPLHSSRGPTGSRGLASTHSFAQSDAGYIGVLSVRIIAAYNLVNMDSGVLGDVSDPYVSFRLHSQSEQQRKRTHTINNDLNPRWNSAPQLLQISLEDDQLILEVWDEDVITSDDFLGRMKIPLYKIIHGQPNQAVRIRDELQDIQHGELEVELGFSPG
eukprot:TRINITY_DN5423_c0_g2_i1.p1 TRINITY_DN5423_c0_g2~~TRINITY_DN5423_c0_g2_i1.p1  ORF type:complete len:1075 (+),score=187.94 TRINITY_DN5423_c0_g2_i1:50-3274(+)